MSLSNCNCAACQLRRLTAPLVLIAIGVLLLVHMLRAGFDDVAMVACFLLFGGGLQLAQYAAPRAPSPPHAPRGSVFVPLLLIALGVLMLVRHLLPRVPLGGWIAHYWPLLLILWGLTRLAEHYALAPRARPGLSGGEILMVVLIIVFGLGFSGIYRFRQSRLANYMGVNVENWNPFLQSYPFSAAAQTALGAAQSVLVRGYRGDVNLIAGPPGSVAAAVADTVHADGRSAAQNLFQASQPLFRREGTQLVVLPAGEGSSGVEADLRLTLPASTPVIVQIDDGDVSVPAWQADLAIHAEHGSITAGHIAGNLQITSGHDSVSVDQVTGNVNISGGGDDVAISNVTGATTLEGQFVGSLNFRNLAHGLRFNSSRTGLAISALPGSVIYDMGQITIGQASDVNLRTRDEEINVHDFTGPLQIDNRDESVTVSSAAPIAAPITIADHDADIRLNLPAGSHFALAATSHNGDIENDFGIPQRSENHQAESQGGVGPAVHLDTTNGTIAIRAARPH